MTHTTEYVSEGTCDTCGATHVFDNEINAIEWEADHGDLGHTVTVTPLS